MSPTQPVPGDPNYQDQDLFITSQKAFTQEIRIQSNGLDSRFTWLAGVFYQHELQSSNQYVPDTPASFNALVESAFAQTTQQVFGMGLYQGKYSYTSVIDSIDKQLAGFGEVNLKVVSGLTLTAGVRAERSTFAFTNTSNGPFNGGLSEVNGDESEKPITPKYGLSYQLDPANLFYVTISKGFRPGGANPAIPARCDTDLAELGRSEERRVG